MKSYHYYVPGILFLSIGLWFGLRNDQWNTFCFFSFVGLVALAANLKQIRDDKKTRASREEAAANGDIPLVSEFIVEDIDSGVKVGKLPYDQLKELMDIYVNEYGHDSNDFFILREEIEKLKSENHSLTLVAFLEQSLGNKDAMTLRWSSK